MIVDAASLKDLYSGFNVSFNKGFKKTVAHWDKVAMKVTSTGSEENYSWLGDLPGIREWLGERFIHRLSAARHVIVNRKFEQTIAVLRDKIADDQYGIYAPLFEKMGYDTAQHPDDLVFSLLKLGFTTRCFDEQYFFDTDHPGYDENGEEVSVSNMQAGANPPWFLVDNNQPIKPLIYQEREGFKFESLINPTDAHVFFKDEYVYGVRGRSNAGFGLWQMCFASRATLDETNFVAARTAMMNFRRKSGKPIGIMPTHLIVPPSLDAAARKLLKALKDDGGSNEWANSVEPVVTAFLT